ncbi:aminoglycoside 6-adenylyltransferase [Paenibacillus alba]|uniref:aminoglycoside 6-adenylyltransferase n=1 Tax=Paenibacillus alba TaxID=1197127 RepID=UPI0023DDA0DC|nr:aminoglycoside 6-adenylyltransferase [Paenibacillus alba]
MQQRDENEIWDALFEALQLTRIMGTEIAQQLGCSYPLQDDERVVAYLKQVRMLPRDAQQL